MLRRFRLLQATNARRQFDATVVHLRYGHVPRSAVQGPDLDRIRGWAGILCATADANPGVCRVERSLLIDYSRRVDLGCG